MKWRRLKLAFAAAITAIVAGSTYVQWRQSLTPAQRQVLKADLEAAVAEEPGIAPLVRRVCPGCVIPQDCCKMTEDTFCRFNMTYGPGVGGVDRDGNPVVCTCDFQTHEAWPCGGRSKRWPKRVKRLLANGDEEQIMRALRRYIRNNRDPEPE